MRTLSSASKASIAQEKQVLLECILQNPTRSWFKYMDSRQTFRVCLLLHLGQLSLTRKSMRRV